MIREIRRALNHRLSLDTVLAAVVLLAVAGATVWLLVDGDDGDPAPAVAVPELQPVPSGSNEQPLAVGDQDDEKMGAERPRRPSRERSREPTTNIPSEGRARGAVTGSGEAPESEAPNPDARDAGRTSADIRRLIEEGLGGAGGTNAGRPPGKIGKLLEQGLGDGGQEESGGLPPTIEQAMEQIARGG